MTLLPRRAEAHADTVLQHVFVFRLAAARFALPAAEAVAVAEVESCTHVPSADSTLLGVGRVGPRLLPLIDAHRRMRLGAPAPGAFPWTCLVVKGALGEVAFRIDEVLGLRAMPAGQAPPGCALLSVERLIDGSAGGGA